MRRKSSVFISYRSAPALSTYTLAVTSQAYCCWVTPPFSARKKDTYVPWNVRPLFHCHANRGEKGKQGNPDLTSMEWVCKSESYLVIKIRYISDKNLIIILVITQYKGLYRVQSTAPWRNKVQERSSRSFVTVINCGCSVTVWRVECYGAACGDTSFSASFPRVRISSYIHLHSFLISNWFLIRNMYNPPLPPKPRTLL